MSSSSRRRSADINSRENILTRKYLEKATSKNDLLKRLRTIYKCLQDDDENDEQQQQSSNLDTLSQLLSSSIYLNHRDKEIRLLTVLCCMEIFTIYVPEPPWDEVETIRIFEQLLRQLGNLIHTTSSEQSVHYTEYIHLLEVLAEVRIGVVLVEMFKSLDNDNEDETTTTAANVLDVLVDFCQTLIRSIHIDHEQEVQSFAVKAIASVLEEFDSTIPIEILEVLLVAIGEGPTVQVTNPAAVEVAARNAKAKKRHRKKGNHSPFKQEKLPPLQISQTNPSYTVAASTINKCVDLLSTPLASCLNGLLNGDDFISSKTSITTAESSSSSVTVWNIIYELHRVAPSVLTTVIGTVTHSLLDPTPLKRLRVVKLLGRLFYDQKTNMALDYAACFREWLNRSNDTDVPVRLAMVKYFILILSNKVDVRMIREAVTTKLCFLLDSDPSPDVRLAAIRQVCDLSYRGENGVVVSAELLHSIGGRVSAKHKTQRKDALSGLSQIYFKKYLWKRVVPVHAGGDDVEIDVILDTLHPTQNAQDEECYSWIPATVLKAASILDSQDAEMHSRVIQVIDEVLLGHPAKTDLTVTARAVGLAIAVQSIKSDSDGLARWHDLLKRRSQLQHAVGAYLDSRIALKAAKRNTEDAIVASANAVEKLHAVAALTAPPPSPGSLEGILESFHGARDNHIFRLLSTISDPNHSLAARTRALDELPKRTKQLGDDVSVWVKALTRRCAMGGFMNEELVHHCILLAQECFREDDLDACMAFLDCVKMASDVFPSLCSKKQDYGTLLELFDECQRITGVENRKVLEKAGTLSIMSSILAKVAPTLKNKGLDKELQKQFLKLCTGDGTPEQAKHTIYMMASMLGSEDEDNDDSKQYDSILKALTSSSRMTIGNDKVVNILAALTALAEKSPSLFEKGAGAKAIRFAMETVLLGRGGSKSDPGEGDDEDEDFEEEEAANKTPSKRKSKSPGKSPGRRKNTTPAKNVALLDNVGLTIACRRACSALEFLVAHIRMSVLQQRAGKDVPVPSSSHIAQIFQMLTHILQDKGLPPSSRDRRDCKARQDRAALRQCCASQLFRLCDRRLALSFSNGMKALEEKFLTIGMWHTLAGTLLDEEQTVRETAIEELSNMLLGRGHFEGSEIKSMPPSLRFVAMSVFCADGDGHRSHSVANGNAANVGKLSYQVKSSTLQVVLQLRKTCEALLNGCRQAGREAERQFEYGHKMKVMPEYAVPYAIHLLCLRRETPSAGGSVPGVPGLTQPAEDATNDSDDEGDEEQVKVDDSAQQRMLRKRLKWLFEPLVESLGAGADNISFLLRLSEMIGSHHQPVEMRAQKRSAAKLSQSDESMDSLGLSPVEPSSLEVRNRALLVAKLKTTCLAAREVLLSFVKKDVNLSTYPGQVFIPQSLFRKLDVKASQESFSSLATKSTETSRKKSTPSGGKRDQKNSSRVHFSPDVVIRKRRAQDDDEDSEEFGAEFDGTSPAKGSPGVRSTPGRSTRSAASEKTMGTTPPSNIKTAPSTFEDSSEDEIPKPAFEVDSDLSMTPSPRARRAAMRRKNQLLSQETLAEDANPPAMLPKKSAASRAALSQKDDNDDDDDSSQESPSRSTRSQRRSAFPLTQISTSSQSTPSAIFEEDEDDRKPRAKRKSSPTSVAINKKHRKTRVEVGDRHSFDSMSTASSNRGRGARTRRRGSAARKATSSSDEMDFHGDDDKSDGDAEFASLGRNRRGGRKRANESVAAKTNKTAKTSNGARSSMGSSSTVESQSKPSSPKRSRLAKKSKASNTASVNQKNGKRSTSKDTENPTASSRTRSTSREGESVETKTKELTTSDEGSDMEEEAPAQSSRKRRGGQITAANQKKWKKTAARSRSLESSSTADSPRRSTRSRKKDSMQSILGEDHGTLDSVPKEQSLAAKRSTSSDSDEDIMNEVDSAVEDTRNSSRRSARKNSSDPAKSLRKDDEQAASTRKEAPAGKDVSASQSSASTGTRSSRRSKNPAGKDQIDSDDDAPKEPPARETAERRPGRATKATGGKRSASLSSTSTGTRSTRRSKPKKQDAKDPLDFDDDTGQETQKELTKRRPAKSTTATAAKSAKGAKQGKNSTTEVRRSRRTRK